MQQESPPILLKEEVYAIVGAAIEVHRILGSGFLEAVYQEAFEYELSQRQIPYETQVEVGIFYKDHILEKRYRADLICCDQIIIELKASSAADRPRHRSVAQLPESIADAPGPSDKFRQSIQT